MASASSRLRARLAALDAEALLEYALSMSVGRQAEADALRDQVKMQAEHAATLEVQINQLKRLATEESDEDARSKRARR